MHCKSLWIKASAKCINVNVQGKLEWGRSNRHRGIHRSLDSVWGSTSPEMKTSPVYGMQTQVGQTFARHMQNLFVSHVNKFTKWPVARHIQMLVSVTCMSSNNNQMFVDVVLYMAMPMFLFFCHNGQICCSMILSVWQCQCAGYI